MPTIYGEGHAAFRRLQEEIMKRSPDQTIFAWGLVPRVENETRRTSGDAETALLAGEEDDDVQRLTSEPAEDLFSLSAMGGAPRNPLLIQLNSLVDDRPDEVLAVLRGWIVEGAAG